MDALGALGRFGSSELANIGVLPLVLLAGMVLWVGLSVM